MQKQNKNEKRRSTNFTSAETNLLVKLVHDRKDILDCSKLDSVTLDKKNAAWHKITDIFNSKNEASIRRDEKALKKKYSNLKSTTKDWSSFLHQAQSEMRDLSSIDASDRLSNVSDEEKSKTQSTKNETIDSLSNIQTEQTRPCKMIEKEDLSEDEAIDTDWDWQSKYPSTPYRSNFHPMEKNSINEGKSLEKNKERWSEEKAKLEMEILEIEHRERIKMMKRKHEMEMEKLQLQNAKHKLEIELLNVELAYKKQSFQNIAM